MGLMDRTASADQTGRTLDILVLSGGGDFGAFGAGILGGWSQVKGEGAMPTFDVVTGVSAGALIAPFAFLGQKEDLEMVESLFRDPKPDWIKARGLLGFLPDNESLAELPGLERELKAAVDDARISRIVDEGKKGRRLFVNTTDLDLGGARPFELTTAASNAMETGSSERFHNILLASAGIPGAFPSRQIDGILYVDGGVSSNILYGAWGTREESFAYQFAKRYPDQPKPRIRYWVILNNQAQTPPKTVQPGWIRAASSAGSIRRFCRRFCLRFRRGILRGFLWGPLRRAAAAHRARACRRGHLPDHAHRLARLGPRHDRLGAVAFWRLRRTRSD